MHVVSHQIMPLKVHTRHPNKMNLFIVLVSQRVIYNFNQTLKTMFIWIITWVTLFVLELGPYLFNTIFPYMS